MHVLKLHHADLSTATLKAIRSDLAKYSHLKMYVGVYQEISAIIEARETEERQQRRAARPAA